MFLNTINEIFEIAEKYLLYNIFFSWNVWNNDKSIKMTSPMNIVIRMKHFYREYLLFRTLIQSHAELTHPCSVAG